MLGPAQDLTGYLQEMRSAHRDQLMTFCDCFYRSRLLGWLLMQSPPAPARSPQSELRTKLPNHRATLPTPPVARLLSSCLPRLLLLPQLALALMLSAADPSHAQRQPCDRPNLVLIFLDDAGYGDFSHTGHPTIHTPNLTRMAAEGLDFRQYYCAVSACTASRYALLTGRYAARSGFGRWVLGPDADRHIHANEITIAKGLNTRGYASGIFGKWHLGSPNEANDLAAAAFPLAHGFDTWFGLNVSNDYLSVKLFRAPSELAQPVPGYEVVTDNVAQNDELQAAMTRKLTDETIGFIRRHQHQPFFAYLPYTMPHLPIHPGPEHAGRSLRGPYGDVIEEIDHELGRILETLKELQIERNTLVVFTSDNGPWISFWNRTERGDQRFNVGDSGLFRDGKGSGWEGGVRVPGVFWWPGTIAPGRVERRPSSTLDLLPTMFALAEVPLPADRELDGRDVRPYLNPERFGGEVAEFEFFYTGPRNQLTAIRRGPWKMHWQLYSQLDSDHGFSASPDQPLLFQVEHDPAERFDLAADQPEVVGELQRRVDEFRRQLEVGGTFWDR